MSWVGDDDAGNALVTSSTPHEALKYLHGPTINVEKEQKIEMTRIDLLLRVF